MEIKRIGTTPSAVGPAEWFTGAVRVDSLFDAVEPGHVSGASVTFEPGARTVWHTHPLGQTLVITAGCGWVRRWDGPVEEVHPGDVVRFAPGEKHWHGATATTGMSHLAIQEAFEGQVVTWLEHVSEEQYQKGDNPMTNWMNDELDKIGTAEELDIAPMRADGSLLKAVTIWVVRVGDDLYVRSHKGRGSGWFSGVLTRHEGRISAGGVVKDVVMVEESDPAIQDRIDAAYWRKYRRYPAAYVDSVVTDGARAATIRLVPR